MSAKQKKNYYILTAQILGTCHECGQKTYGTYDFQKESEREFFVLECLDCSARFKCELDSRMIEVWNRGELEAGKV